MLPQKRRPTTPGEILREEFLAPYKLTQGDFAQRVGLPTETINRIVNDKRAITAETALRLSAALGTTPEFWMNLQSAVDLWDTQNEKRPELRKIKKLSA